MSHIHNLLHTEQPAVTGCDVLYMTGCDMLYMTGCDVLHIPSTGRDILYIQIKKNKIYSMRTNFSTTEIVALIQDREVRFLRPFLYKPS